MPELPDLQVFSRNLGKALQGKTLEHIELKVSHKGGVSQKELDQAVSSKKLRDVSRVGKQLCFDFGEDARLFMHLMLHGKLFLQKDDEPAPRYVLAALSFGKTVLYLTDFQKAAHLQLNVDPGGAIDALSKELTASWLTDKLNGSRAKIKSLLMDQKVIAGIGNAYADEILWEARINPESIAGKIPASAIKKLSTAIRSVLTAAEKAIIKEHPDIIAGEIRNFMKVHNSKKESSPTGAEIVSTTVGGRKTYYTKEQELFR